ncbi:hypothetical protein JQ608_06605 [Bradyrhizobium liaoningense]|uniref:hypothetical protein n=1 Tax=Bradyrhizobium liaoningense TaxID=43992 RepID=UPI001BAB75C3|nr:hypothetical protein [Bradyrhizobium liaoningense]MBR0876871.1 hypothetical protein [Bradyrhizobium liaoningense]
MSAQTLMLLTFPTIVVVYVLGVRPMLRELPQFKALYAEADGLWQKVWAACGKSALLAGSYVAQVVGWSFQALDPIAELLGDPDLKAQIADALHSNPKALGMIMSVISAVIIAARLRNLFKGA